MGILSELFGMKKSRTSSSNLQSVASENVYSGLTRNQKLAAMNLMMVFGGSCSGSPQELGKINHIMTEEGKRLGITGEEMHAATSRFNGMEGMVDALKGADRVALANLFWPFYCIVSVGKDEQAIRVLLAIYEDYGFSIQDCVNILEKISGRKISSI